MAAYFPSPTGEASPVRVRSEFITPKPPPVIQQTTAQAMLAMRFAKRRKQPKSTGKEEDANESKPLAIIQGTGKMPSYDDDDELPEELTRPADTYNELQRIVMRVNRVFDAYSQGTDGEEGRLMPTLTAAEVEMLQIGVFDMLNLQERVAMVRTPRRTASPASRRAGTTSLRRASRAPSRVCGAC